MSEHNIIDLLNNALSLEYSAMIQYNQHRFLLTGKDREVYKEFFKDQSKEAHKHSVRLGDKIVALGGVPTVEPSVIRQATSLADMLKQDLEMEKEALSAYIKAWEAAGDNHGLKFWLEDIIAEEQLHVDEIAKLASDKEIRSDRVNREIRFKGVK